MVFRIQKYIKGVRKSKHTFTYNLPLISERNPFNRPIHFQMKLIFKRKLRIYTLLTACCILTHLTDYYVQAIVVHSNWYLPIWSNFLIRSHKDEKIDRKWTCMPIGVLTHKNSLVSKESYRKVFDRTEFFFDLYGQKCPDL